MTSYAFLKRVVAIAGLLATTTCSQSPERPRPARALPTAPSASGSMATFVDPASDRFVTTAVAFPSPQDALAFRQVLEAKFQALGKPLQTTYVNAEGVIVWTLEFLRYRASGCSQADAIDKVFTQIDRRGVPALCNESVSGTPVYPPQADSLGFRQLLEVKYRDQLGAPPIQTYVDQPSEMLYTQEFVRYAQSGCSSASAYERVFVQIDGRGVEPDCTPNPPAASCEYGISPASQSAAAAGGGLNAAIFAEPSECSWRLAADVPWITGTTTSGTGSRSVNYTVAANGSSQSRSGRITLTGNDGTQRVQQVNQAGLTTSPPGPPGPAVCTYAVSPSTVNAIYEGGTYDVQVTTQTGCAWNASSSVPWASIVSGGSGTGSGTVRFDIPRNAGDERRGTADISYSGGSQSILLSQASPPIRAIIVAPIECATDTNCNFDGSNSRGIISNYVWTFGDGGKGTGATVTHVYPFAYVSDDYPEYSIDTTVTLTVTGPAGSSTATAIVRVFYDPGSNVVVVSTVPDGSR